MKITAIKTHKVTEKDKSIKKLIDIYINSLDEKSILVITSKVVAISEGRIVPIGTVEKDDLITQEADLYLPRKFNKYNVLLTITHNDLAATAGIDESNGNGFYILLPENPQKSADEIREYLLKKFNLANVGVLITDSRSTFLRAGAIGRAIAHSGFKGLNDLRGKRDIFGRILKIEQVNLLDSIAAASVAVMGESNEQTPFAIVEDIPFVKFQTRNPSKKELSELTFDIGDDLYGSILSRAPWKKGKAKK